MTEIKWQDTNLALFGSDLDKQVKKEAGLTEPAWSPVLKTASAKLFVWRIEKFLVKPVSSEEYGEFYNGDSYIVLNVTKVGDQLNYDVHFWIGEHSTADEYGTAAYKTVELDTVLDGKAIQHREVEGYESSLFKSYFKSLQILHGGVASGFRHVRPNEYTPRLLHFALIAKKQMVIQEIALSRNSLESGDVYILDLGTRAIQWNGSKSNMEERFAAAQFGVKLSSDRFGKCKVSVVDEGDDMSEFNDALPDVEVKRTHKDLHTSKSIYKLSDESGGLKFDLISSNSAPKSALTEDDVYFIDSGDEMFVYIGANCSEKEKLNAMGYAHNFLKSGPRKEIPITVVKSGQHSSALNAAVDAA